MEKKNAFQFVDGTKTDRATKQLIRSHVMIGKNAGRKVHRPSRLGLAKPKPYGSKGTTACITKRRSSPAADASIGAPVWIARSPAGGFFTLGFPLSLTSQSWRAINQFFAYVVEKMFPTRIGFSVDDARAAWLGVLFSDEAASHCSISLMETCNEFFLGRGASSQVALQHLAQTLALVRRRLGSEEALSDSTIGIIVMLMIQEQLRNGRLSASVHFEGLKRMVELRGGLDQLEESHALLTKICKTDITYCLQYGQPIFYYRDRMPEVELALAAKGFRLDRIAAARGIRHDGLDPRLRDVLLDASSISLLFNRITGGHNIELGTLNEMVVSLFSRVLQFRPLGSPADGPNLEDAYQIGLIFSLMSSFLQYDGRRVVDFDLASTRLRAVLARGLDELDTELALWVALLGAIWDSGSTHRNHSLDLHLISLARHLHINSWAAARNIVSQFPWINGLHDPPGRRVWDSVSAGSQAGAIISDVDILPSKHCHI